MEDPYINQEIHIRSRFLPAPLILFSIQSQSMSTRGPTSSVCLFTPVVGLMHKLLFSSVFYSLMIEYKGSHPFIVSWYIVSHWSHYFHQEIIKDIFSEVVRLFFVCSWSPSLKPSRGDDTTRFPDQGWSSISRWDIFRCLNATVWRRQETRRKKLKMTCNTGRAQTRRGCNYKVSGSNPENTGMPRCRDMWQQRLWDILLVTMSGWEMEICHLALQTIVWSNPFQGFCPRTDVLCFALHIALMLLRCSDALPSLSLRLLLCGIVLRSSGEHNRIVFLHTIKFRLLLLYRSDSYRLLLQVRLSSFSICQVKLYDASM